MTNKRVFHCCTCNCKTTHQRESLTRNNTYKGMPIEYTRDCYVCDECESDEILTIEQQKWLKLEIDAAIGIAKDAAIASAEFMSTTE